MCVCGGGGTMAPGSRPRPVHSFAEVLGLECRGSSTLELSLKNEQLVLHTARASTIKAMVELFLSELKKASVGQWGARWGVSTDAAWHPVRLAWSQGCQPRPLELPGVGLGVRAGSLELWGAQVKKRPVEGGAGGAGRTGPLTPLAAGLWLRCRPAKLHH